jgi:hypothetical protein
MGAIVFYSNQSLKQVQCAVFKRSVKKIDSLDNNTALSVLLASGLATFWNGLLC